MKSEATFPHAFRIALAVALLCAGCDPSAFEALPGDAAVVDPGAMSGESASAEDAAQRVPSLDAGGDAGSSSSADAKPEPRSDASNIEVDASEPTNNADGGMSLPVDAGTGAPPDAASMMCIGVDFARDAKNCGTCGFDCAAANAEVSCQNRACVRTCKPGYDDCNNDKDHGLLKDGCETRVDTDVNRCGGCFKRCKAPGRGFASCRAGLCYAHELQNRRILGVTPVLHGNDTGGAPFSALCADGEVMTGIVGDAIGGKPFKLLVECAKLQVKSVNGVYTVSLVPSAPSPTAGTYAWVDSAPFALRCPAATVATSVAGDTHNFQGQPSPSVSRITITCAGINISAARKVSFTGEPFVQSVGSSEFPVVTAFSDPCAPGGAVVGVTGRIGGYVDAIATSCGELSLSEQAGESTSNANAATAEATE